jgi:hypothetical protein
LTSTRVCGFVTPRLLTWIADRPLHRIAAELHGADDGRRRGAEANWKSWDIPLDFVYIEQLNDFQLTVFIAVHD